MPSKTAKLFTNGGSQAVRLPSEFRFEGDEVLVRKDERTGDVILSPKNTRNTWAEFFSVRDSGRKVTPDFMSDRPLNAPLTQKALFTRKP
jgi:antitoxin VapB